jgi:GLPGLI family protein
MKKLFISMALSTALAAGAQVQGKSSELAPMKEGKVVYERTSQMRRPENLDPEVAARFPTSRTDVFELLFTSEKSLWRGVPRTDVGNGDFSAQSPNGGMVVMRMGGGVNDESFTDLAQHTRIDKRELFDKELVVADSIRPLAWKFSNDSKTILGHTARKAVTQRIGQRMTMSMENGEMKRIPVADTSSIVAWFTTEVPVPVGPAEYQTQLPGLVLEVDINNGRTIYKAIELSPKVSVASIKEPKGKRLTPAEFDKEREAAMSEMSKNMPGGMQIKLGN